MYDITIFVFTFCSILPLKIFLAFKLNLAACVNSRLLIIRNVLYGTHIVGYKFSETIASVIFLAYLNQLFTLLFNENIGKILNLKNIVA